MISLGEINYDSYDSGAGVIDVLSQGDRMFIRIHKLDPSEDSRRPRESRDVEQWMTFELNNRNLSLIRVRSDKYVVEHQVIQD